MKTIVLTAAAARDFDAQPAAAREQGASRLKALRRWRDFGQVHLAFQTEISQGFLSDLENGKRNMAAAVRQRIAKILDVPENWLG